MKLSWRDRISDPWFVLPLGALAGAVLALSLAIALHPDNNIPGDADVAQEGTPIAASPVASPSPGPGALDDVRRADAYRIAAAAFAYYRANGAYPATAGDAVEPLCGDPPTAGCRLAAYLPSLPADPARVAGRSYWYRSGGSSFTLFMSMDTAAAAATAACPGALPQPVAAVEHLYCLELGPPR